MSSKAYKRCVVLLNVHSAQKVNSKLQDTWKKCWCKRDEVRIRKRDDIKSNISEVLRVWLVDNPRMTSNHEVRLRCSLYCTEAFESESREAMSEVLSEVLHPSPRESWCELRSSRRAEACMAGCGERGEGGDSEREVTDSAAMIPILSQRQNDSFCNPGTTTFILSPSSFTSDPYSIPSIHFITPRLSTHFILKMLWFLKRYKISEQ